jgi:short subunit dehydrogenase-like uncharacterized protein
MSNQPSHDIVVYGATGFTGRLVCAYLAQRAKDLGDLGWALAGRSLSKLVQVRDETGAGDIPLVEADASDPASIEAMAASTRVVLTTVGPYAVYGTPLVAACAKSGTDYVDLSGEPIWMRKMIDEYEGAARASGARILFACGFDSIPSELGVWLLQRSAVETLGKPMPRVRARVVTFIGGPGGGSLASGVATMKAAESDPEAARLLEDPFGLTPDFRGPDQPTGQDAGMEPDVGPVVPFMLGPTNAKNVHRGNFLMQHPYGTDFVYDEMLVGDSTFSAPAGPLPKPGEGPGPDVIANGRFEMLFIGSDPDGREIRTVVAGSRDPGFGATSGMVSETALCLLEDRSLAPGILTPGSSFPEKLVERLAAYADMTFGVVGDEPPSNETKRCV